MSLYAWEYPVGTTSNHNFAGYFDNLTVTPTYPNDTQWQTEVDGGSTNANQMSWRSLIWGNGTLPSGTTATFKGRSCSGSGGTGNCGTWESSSLSVGGVLTFTGVVSNERYLQVQADLASDTTRQNTPTVGEVDLTYQITSTLPSIKYYYLGSQRVAMRGGNEVYYLHGDHLGSTSLTTNVTGTVVAETRHHPFGEVRWESGSSVTDFGFTGQRNEVEFGLMDYNARYYSPGLGRFVSADTIVPDFGNSQGLNRYSYVYNNPLIYVDPSGHCSKLSGWVATACQNTVLPVTNAIHKTNDWAAGNQEALVTAQAAGVDVLPVVGDAKGFVEIFTGRDLMTGEELGHWRWAGLIFLSELRVLRHGDEVADGIKFVGRNSDETSDLARAIACSFDEETLVSTIDGFQPIGEIKPGIYVLGYNEGTGETAYYEVIAVLVHQDPIIEYITFESGEVIATTPEHLFYGLSSWLPAGELKPGYLIRKADGSYGVIEAIVFVEEPQWMYNLTVDTAHTFFVGQGQWLVHNTCFRGKTGKDVFNFLNDGDTLTNDDILDAGAAFLGDGYRQLDTGVFISEDNTRLFRITEADITGKHAGGPHANFEIVKPVKKWNGSFSYESIDNKHIYFTP